jgi:hypothetical protein
MCSNLNTLGGWVKLAVKEFSVSLQANLPALSLGKLSTPSENRLPSLRKTGCPLGKLAVPWKTAAPLLGK